MSVLLQVHEEVEVDASAEKVWSLIGDFYHCWIDQVVVTAIDANTRKMPTPDGGSVTEILLSHSDKSMMMKYEMIEGDLPVKNYQCSLSVERENSVVTVCWNSSFVADGVNDDQAVSIVSNLYKMGLQYLERKLNY